MDKDALIEAFKKARKSLVDFRHIVLRNGDNEVNPAEFHYKWSDLLLNGNGHFAIEGFRESAKDQYVNRAFPLYCLLFPSKERNYLVILRNNDTQATKSIEAIRNEALSNPAIKTRIVNVVKATSNCLIVDCLADGGEEITVTIEGYGKGASIRGLANNDKRPDIIICNDLQDIEDSRSDTVQEKDWEWFLSDVKFLGQYTRIFMIGNNLGEKCIIERIFRDPASTGFETQRVAIADPAMELSSWPSKYTIEQVLKERKDYDQLGKLAIWLRERMCVAVSDETRIFRDEDYTYYTPALAEKISAEAQEVFATLDPASSKGLESCFRAIVVCARMRDGHWYILEVPYGRWDSVGLLDKMFEVCRKFGIRRFGIEKGHFHQVLEPFIYKEMTRLGIRFVIVPLEHGKIGSKLERIKMLQPRFKAHSVWFPQSAYWLDEIKSELAGVTSSEIKSMYIDLCFAAGTKIATLFGDKAIENVRRGDIVLTPFGLSNVTESKMTGNTETITKFGVTATPGHKVFSFNKGFASIDALCYSDEVSRLTTKEMMLWRYRKLLFSMGTSISSTGRESIIHASGVKMENTIGMDFITQFGSFLTKGEFRKVITFTTSTGMCIITTFLILSVYRLSNIIVSLKTSTLYLSGIILRKLGRSPRSGINLKPGLNGIANTLLSLQRGAYLVAESVIYAARNTITNILHQSSAPQHVCNGASTYQEDLTSQGNVLFVERALLQTNIRAQRHVAGHVQQSSAIEPANKVPVYNITVKNVGVYYANGLLVSNCDALAMCEQMDTGLTYGVNADYQKRTSQPARAIR